MKVLVIWTIVIVALAAGFFLLLTQPIHVNVSQPFGVSQGNYIVVSGSEDASARFAASDSFILRKGDLVINGHQTPPPLGWPSKAYYVAEAEQFTGAWELIKGDLTAEVTGAQDVAVGPTETRTDIIGVVCFVIAVILWLIGTGFILK